MTNDGPVPDADQVCPYLGLSGDPATHYASTSSLHRCFAARRPDTIEPTKQARDCLTDLHVACPRYHPPAVATQSGRLPGGALASPSPGPTRLVAGSGRTMPTPRLPPARRVGEIALVALLLVGAGAAGLLGLGSRPAEPTGGAPGTAVPGAGGSTPSSVSGAAASPSDPATPSPTPSPATPRSTPTATPAPTARPVPTPSRVVYTVKPGDTLTSIARLYGVSVAALQVANRVEHPGLVANPGLIFAGQRIVIPS